MRVFAIVAVLLTAAGSLRAQEGTGWVALQGGFISQASDSIYKGSPAFGIGFGGWFTDHWGAEISILGSPVKFKDSEGRGGETRGLVSGLFNFNPGGATLFPYVRLGLGTIAFQGDLKITEGKRRADYHGGLGIQGFFGEHFIGVLEFRENRVGKNNPHRNEAMGLLGVGYRWGGRTGAGQTIPVSAEPPPPERPMVEALPVPPPTGPPPVILLPEPH